MHAYAVCCSCVCIFRADLGLSTLAAVAATRVALHPHARTDPGRTHWDCQLEWHKLYVHHTQIQSRTHARTPVAHSRTRTPASIFIIDSRKCRCRGGWGGWVRRARGGWLHLGSGVWVRV